MPYITAIIPAYNEQLTIGSVVISTSKYVDQVLVIDDGSTDNTAEIAEEAGARIIKHNRNRGKGAALKTGFHAVEDADIIITLDSDGQHNPQEIPKLIKPIIDGEADLVNGSRYLDKRDNETPKYRRLGQLVLDKATNISSGLELTDSQSGYRAFSAHTIPAFRFTNSDFSIESEMLTDAAEYGYRITEVPVGVSYNHNSNLHTENPVSHGMGVLVRILQDMEFRRPLYYFTIPGLVLIITGLVLGLYFFGQYLDRQMATLMPTIIAGLIGLGGIFIAFTGIILHSMAGMINRSMKK